jgi:hypothetical protein
MEKESHIRKVHLTLATKVGKFSCGHKKSIASEQSGVASVASENFPKLSLMFQTLSLFCRRVEMKTFRLAPILPSYDFPSFTNICKIFLQICVIVFTILRKLILSNFYKHLYVSFS